MKKIIYPIFFIAAPSIVFSMTSIKNEHVEYFKEVVKLMGFRCDTSDGGYAVSPAHIGGTIFKIYCNNSSLSYRVIVGGEKICVEPWDKDPASCM